MPARFDTIHFANIDVLCEQTLDAALDSSHGVFAAVHLPEFPCCPLLNKHECASNLFVQSIEFTALFEVDFGGPLKRQ